MSEPSFERPFLPLEEVQAGYREITELDTQLEGLEEKRDARLKEIRSRIKTSSLPDEAKLIALALEANQRASKLEYLTVVDEAIRKHSEDLVGRVCYEGIRIPGKQSERIAMV